VPVSAWSNLTCALQNALPHKGVIQPPDVCVDANSQVDRGDVAAPLQCDQGSGSISDLGSNATTPLQCDQGSGSISDPGSNATTPLQCVEIPGSKAQGLILTWTVSVVWGNPAGI
jgi:hypothetical protein